MSKNVETKETKGQNGRGNMKWSRGCWGGLIVAIIAFFVALIYSGQNAYEAPHLYLALIISLIVAVLAGLIGWGVVEGWQLRKEEAEYARGCWGGLIVWLIASFVAFIFLFFPELNADTVGGLGFFAISSLILAFPAGAIVWAVVTWWLSSKKESEEDSS